MANTKQSKKRARQNPVRGLRNTAARSAMRTAIKKANKNTQDKKADLAKSSTQEAAMLLDRLAGKGVIHKNKAARLKSRLNKKARQVTA